MPFTSSTATCFRFASNSLSDVAIVEPGCVMTAARQGQVPVQVQVHVQVQIQVHEYCKWK